MLFVRLPITSQSFFRNKEHLETKLKNTRKLFLDYYELGQANLEDDTDLIEFDTAE